MEIAYEASCDRDTVCNLTNHSYFTLAGHSSGPVDGQTMQIFAGRYTPVLPGAIPTGELADVAGTPLDLRKPVSMGENWDADFEQLRLIGGFDHNWVLDGWDDAPYVKRWGFCLETQYFPDSPNHPNFPNALLKAGEQYSHKTVYRFGAAERCG